MDGESGRFDFITHYVWDGDSLKFNTARDLFPELNGKERYKTYGFKEIAMIYGDTEESFRNTAKLINRIRHQLQGGTPYRTLQENTEKEGGLLIDYMQEKSKRILKMNGFSEDGVFHNPSAVYADIQPVTLADEAVACAAQIAKVDDIAENPVPYEDPEHTVNISADDVEVKRQKDARKRDKEPGDAKRKYVHNTIVHIAKGADRYVLNGYGIRAVLSYVTAFLFQNNLVGCRFQFYTDGHPSVNDPIIKIFRWHKNIGIILDWYHLVKKCKERLSMGMKGRVSRNETLRLLMPILWSGKTDKAIDFLKGIAPDSVKNNAEIEMLINYLTRNKPYIPCYAVRKVLGLRNSSNLGEKMNDLVVSKRQKHNGMSWSKSGSVALASVTALKRNKEFERWFEKHELNFKLAA